jgi:hypothetical protein
MEARLVVALEHLNCTLGEDWSGVDSPVNHVHRTTSDAYAVGNRIAHAMSARERWQQSRVGVNDAIWEFTEESWAEHTHESSTDNQVGIVRTHQISEGKVPVVT